MPKLISEKNQLQQLSLNSNGGVVYQPARGFFKVVYQGLILPNLLHHFVTLITLV